MSKEPAMPVRARLASSIPLSTGIFHYLGMIAITFKVYSADVYVVVAS